MLECNKPIKINNTHSNLIQPVQDTSKPSKTR